MVVAAAAYTEGDGTSLRVVGEVQEGIVVGDLPSADPHKKGQLWNNAGAINISAG